MWDIRLFSEKFTVKDYISNTKLLKKAIIITSKHGKTIFFSIKNLFYENFTKKCPEKRSKIQT